jgi:hypothetical protein
MILFLHERPRNRKIGGQLSLLPLCKNFEHGEACVYYFTGGTSDIKDF